MEIAYQAFKLLSLVLFLYYGLRCLVSDAMASEFERFGLARFRRFTGVLETLAHWGC